ncbi:hypothetical protein [Microbacterium sp. 22195]|uniref:hypothetical protein n=1 Tax=Microbacterium sp. 22195 TaxID=3453891 RepID=UPI003F848CD1
MTMEAAQLITIILSSSVVSGIVLKLFDLIKDARAGQLQQRRAEVDRAETEKDKAIARADAAEAAEEAQARRTRIVEESLAVHRRLIIDAPCLGPGTLPEYPSRSERNP